MQHPFRIVEKLPLQRRQFDRRLDRSRRPTCRPSRRSSRRPLPGPHGRRKSVAARGKKPCPVPPIPTACSRRGGDCRGRRHAQPRCTAMPPGAALPRRPARNGRQMPAADRSGQPDHGHRQPEHDHRQAVALGRRRFAGKQRPRHQQRGHARQQPAVGSGSAVRRGRFWRVGNWHVESGLRSWLRALTN